MSNLFTVKERRLMIVNITKSNGSARSFVVGVMIIVAVGDRSWRAVKFSGSPMEDSRDALHDALAEYFPGLRKVEVPQGDEREVWAAIVNSYHRQISPE